MNLTYKYRLLTKERDYKKLNDLVEDQRQLYNAALEERIECYKRTGKGLSLFDQFKHLAEARREIDYLSEVTSGSSKRDSKKVR